MIDSQQNNQNIDPVNESSLDFFGDIDFQRLIVVVRKSIIWISLVLVLCISAAYVYLRYTPLVFESSSVLKLEIKSDVDALGIQGIPNAQLGNLSGEIELIKSELIYDQVIKNLEDLKISYYSEGRIKDEERFMNSLFELKILNIDPALLDRRLDVDLKDQNKIVLSYEIAGKRYNEELRFGRKFKNDHLEIIPNRKQKNGEKIGQSEYYVIIHSQNALIDMLRKNLDVQVLNPKANTLKILYRDENPRKAMEIVKHINQVYLQNTLELKNQASKQTINFLDDQLKKTEEKLAESERKIEEFIEENKTVNVKDIYRENVGQMETIRNEIRKNKELIIVLDNIEKGLGDADSSQFALLLSGHPELNSYTNLLNNITEKSQRLKELQYSSKPNTVAYQFAKTDLESLEDQMITSLGKERKLIKEENYVLGRELAEIESKIKTLPEKETAYNRLKRNYDLNEKFYLLLMDKKAEFGISEAGIIPDFQVLSPANYPSESVFPQKLDVYLIALGVFVLISFIIIIIGFMVHNTIDSVEEIEKNLTIPLLGSVPFHRHRSKMTKLVVMEKPKAEISEAIRTIRTNLDFMIPNNNGKKILSITSTIGGEGKTFVSVNLGAVISMSNQKVVIVDMDMRKPKLHIALDEENPHGMSNVLIGQMSLDDVIKKTKYANLDFIASGPPPPNPSELILLPDMDEVLEELKSKYDVIIIDTPPIGLVTDALLVMKKVDLPIYIMRSEYSKRAFFRSLIKLKKQNSINNLAIIFNGVKRRGGMGYGYGYNYGNHDVSGYYEDKDSGNILSHLF